jgi:hypothetical protein
MKALASLLAAIALLFAWHPDPNKAIGWVTGCSAYRLNLYGYSSEYQCHGDYTRIHVQFNPPQVRKVFYSKETLAELLPEAVR